MIVKTRPEKAEGNIRNRIMSSEEEVLNMGKKQGSGSANSASMNKAGVLSNNGKGRLVRASANENTQLTVKAKKGSLQGLGRMNINATDLAELTISEESI